VVNKNKTKNKKKPETYLLTEAPSETPLVGGVAMGKRGRAKSL